MVSRPGATGTGRSRGTRCKLRWTGCTERSRAGASPRAARRPEPREHRGRERRSGADGNGAECDRRARSGGRAVPVRAEPWGVRRRSRLGTGENRRARRVRARLPGGADDGTIGGIRQSVRLRRNAWHGRRVPERQGHAGGPLTRGADSPRRRITASHPRWRKASRLRAPRFGCTPGPTRSGATFYRQSWPRKRVWSPMPTERSLPRSGPCTTRGASSSSIRTTVGSACNTALANRVGGWVRDVQLERTAELKVTWGGSEPPPGNFRIRLQGYGGQDAPNEVNVFSLAEVPFQEGNCAAAHARGSVVPRVDR